MGIIFPRMGMEKDKDGLASALFSGVQLRLLSLLIGNPDRAFTISEIIKLARSGTGAVQRELKKLASAGLVTLVSTDHRKLYQANKQAPIFEELNRIILKTTGLVAPIRTALRRFEDRIRFAFVFGSIAKGTDTASSDIDLMIVGTALSYSEIFGALQDAEKQIHRAINPNIVTPAEWDQALSEQNSFFKGIVEQPIIPVIGTDQDVRRT